MSTCHALIDFIDGITQSLDAKQYGIGVFFTDLKKAFNIAIKQLCKKQKLVSVVWHSNGSTVI